MFPIRPALQSDRNYIIKSWVRSLSNQFPFSEMSSNAIAKYSKRVEALLDSCVTIVACDEQNSDVVYGFACGEKGLYLGVDSPTLHYVWVRKPFRLYGIASSLVRKIFPDGDKLIYTHITKAVQHADLKRRWNLVEFDPYFIEGALYSRARNLDEGAICRKGASRGGLVCGAGNGAT